MMQDDTLSLLGLAGLEARQWGFSEEDRQRQELRELREEVEELKGEKGGRFRESLLLLRAVMRCCLLVL